MNEAQSPRTQSAALRPQTFADFAGQDETVRQLKMMVMAARSSGLPIEHTLFKGPRGLGKTTLAKLVAHETGRRLTEIQCVTMSNWSDMLAALVSLEPLDILFLEEVHALPIRCQELLYTALEDGQVVYRVGAGEASREAKARLAPFTCFGATTRAGMLQPPFRDRFPMQISLRWYTVSELLAVVRRGAAHLGLQLDDLALEYVASCGRGSPRVSLRMLRCCRQYRDAMGLGSLELETTRAALVASGYRPLGLELGDLEILRALGRRPGVPLGKDSLAAMLDEEADVIAEVNEPFLLRTGLIERTNRGRIITPAGIKYLEDHDEWTAG